MQQNPKFEVLSAAASGQAGDGSHHKAHAAHSQQQDPADGIRIAGVGRAGSVRILVAGIGRYNGITGRAVDVGELEGQQKQLSDRFRKYFKRSKSLLNKPLNILSDEDKSKLALMLEIAPRLASAYRLKNYFMLVMQAAPDDAPKLLADWLFLAESYGLKEFEACTKAYHNWSEEILNAIRFPWSNGFTEGCNNKTKVLKRVCFGVRNFSRFRNRILHCA